MLPATLSSRVECLADEGAEMVAMTEKASPDVPSVLVVEDNPTSQQALTGLLRQLGCAADQAATGLEALEKVEKGAFAAVLMDLHLPGMDGLRASRLIRAREKVTGRRVSIVGVGLASGPDERQRCLEAGMDEYLPGPVSAPTLQTALERAVGRPLAGGPAEGSSSGWVEALRDMGFDEAGVRDLAETFLATVPARLAELTRCVEQGDAVKTRAAAHALKGSLLVFAVEPLVTAVRELEEAAYAGELGRAREGLLAFDAGVRAFMAELQVYLNQGGN